MPDPINLPLDEEDRLAEPPLIDSLHYERKADGFSVIFVPSVVEDATQTVFVPRDSVEGRTIAAYLYRIQDLISSGINRITHRGGGRLQSQTFQRQHHRVV